MTRDCRAELCKYWPGEGCMRGVMSCDDESGADDADLGDWADDETELSRVRFVPVDESADVW
jgi:hypothetical protein